MFIGILRALVVVAFSLTLIACGGNNPEPVGEPVSPDNSLTEDLSPPATSSIAFYEYSFNSAADQTNPQGAGGSAEVYASKATTTTTYNATGAWDGGSFLRVLLNDTAVQNDAGLFIRLDQLDLTGQMNVGWIARFGSNFINLTETNKMIMFRVGDGTGVVHSESPQMIISQAHNPTAYHVPQISTNPANGGRQDEFGRDYPGDFSDNHTFRFEDHINEWLYYEIQNDPVSATVTLSIFNSTGAIANIDLCLTTSATQISRELYAFRFIGYLWPVAGSDTNSYADIADIYVSDSYIGPPQGFVN